MTEYDFTDNRVSCIHSHPMCEECMEEMMKNNEDKEVIFLPECEFKFPTDEDPDPN